MNGNIDVCIYVIFAYESKAKQKDWASSDEILCREVKGKIENEMNDNEGDWDWEFQLKIILPCLISEEYKVVTNIWFLIPLKTHNVQKKSEL